MKEAKVFVDTNIWLYAIIEQQDISKSKIAKEIIQHSGQIIISNQIINEITVNLLRKTKTNEKTIRKLIESFYENYEIIDLSFEVILQASVLHEKYIFSFWDSLIVCSALKGECRYLISEDMQHNQIIEKSLQIHNPFN